ncbi:ABC-type multidrug transport system ATPase subunit [Pseudomonas sp. S3E17]|nr:ABC-type multidrug transport system ATPase subunit [Pseudomonas sp. S3E17]
MPALHLQHLHKRFGATLALDDASLKVERGSIHGLVGENGAGKSTLIKILAGIHKADAGQVSIDGQSYAALSPRQVDALGVQFIHQERLLPASFTVGEALFFGHELRRGPFVDRRRQQREAERLLAEYFDLQLPVGALVSELNSAERQVLQITRALIRQPKILVFDEPSVALVKREVDQLLRIVKRLRDQGLSILYISHYLQEIDSLCDEVTVLRNGRDVAVVQPRYTSSAEIARLMVNREVQEMYPKAKVALGAPLLQVRGLSLARRNRRPDRAGWLGSQGVVQDTLRCRARRQRQCASGRAFAAPAFAGPGDCRGPCAGAGRAAQPGDFASAFGAGKSHAGGARAVQPLGLVEPPQGAGGKPAADRRIGNQGAGGPSGGQPAQWRQPAEGRPGEVAEPPLRGVPAG